MNINKKILMLIPAGLMATCLLVGGSTYAYFTSTATNSNNTFATGTVHIKVDRDNSDTVPGPMFYSSTSDTNRIDNGIYPYNGVNGELQGGWAPGDELTRTLTIESDGSLKAKLTNISVTIPGSYIAASGDAITGVTKDSTGVDKDAYNEFIDNMFVTVVKTSPGNPANDVTLIDQQSLRSFLDGYTISNPLSLGRNRSTNWLKFTVKLGTSADNKIMGKNIILDFDLTANQE